MSDRSDRVPSGTLTERGLRVLVSDAVWDWMDRENRVTVPVRERDALVDLLVMRIREGVHLDG